MIEKKIILEQLHSIDLKEQDLAAERIRVTDEMIKHSPIQKGDPVVIKGKGETEVTGVIAKVEYNTSIEFIYHVTLSVHSPEASPIKVIPSLNRFKIEKAKTP